MPFKGTVNGGMQSPGSERGGCKGCEFCRDKRYGCLNAVCYCHTHPMEPGED